MYRERAEEKKWIPLKVSTHKHVRLCWRNRFTWNLIVAKCHTIADRNIVKGKSLFILIFSFSFSFNNRRTFFFLYYAFLSSTTKFINFIHVRSILAQSQPRASDLLMVYARYVYTNSSECTRQTETRCRIFYIY